MISNTYVNGTYFDISIQPASEWSSRAFKCVYLNILLDFYFTLTPSNYDAVVFCTAMIFNAQVHCHRSKVTNHTPINYNSNFDALWMFLIGFWYFKSWHWPSIMPPPPQSCDCKIKYKWNKHEYSFLFDFVILIYLSNINWNVY